MKPENIFKGVISWIATMWVGIKIPVALEILLVINAAEIATGLFNAKVHISEQLKRITVSIILVLTALYVYSLAKTQTGLNLGFDVATPICIFYILGSSIKVLKNCNSVPGMELPPWLINALSKADGTSDEQKKELLSLQLQQTPESTRLDVKVNEQSKNKEQE